MREFSDINHGCPRAPRDTPHLRVPLLDGHRGPAPSSSHDRRAFPPRAPPHLGDVSSHTRPLPAPPTPFQTRQCRVVP